MIEDKDAEDVTIINQAIIDIEAVRDDYEPRVDYAETAASYIEDKIDLEHRVANILQPVYKVITKYDLIDPNGIIQGKGKGWGSVEEKEGLV